MVGGDGVELRALELRGAFRRLFRASLRIWSVMGADGVSGCPLTMGRGNIHGYLCEPGGFNGAEGGSSSLGTWGLLKTLHCVSRGVMWVFCGLG